MKNITGGNGYHDDYTETKKLNDKIHRLEVVLSFSIMGIIILVYAIFSISAQFQLMNEKVKMLNRDHLLSLKQLKVGHSLLNKKFAKFEEFIETKYIVNNKSKSESINYYEISDKRKYDERFKDAENIEKVKNDMTTKNTNPGKTIASKMKENKRKMMKNSRNLQMYTDFTDCDYNLFEVHLDLDLEFLSNSTHFTLYDILNENEIIYDTNESVCFEDGHYMLIIDDADGIGMCSGENDCTPYNISINNEVVIEGTDFVNTQYHYFRVHNQIVCNHDQNVIEIQTNQIIQDGVWELIDNRSNEVIGNHSYNAMDPLSLQNISFCIKDGVYFFISDSNNNDDDDYESVNATKENQVSVRVNGNMIGEGYSLTQYRFSIVNGRAQINDNSTECDTNLFHFQLELDEYPEETSWDLIDIQNKVVITYQTYEDAIEFSFQNSFVCVDDGQYMFTIYDSWGDGICTGVEKCSTYNISLNNEPLIEGSHFNAKKSHKLSLKNGTICVGHLIQIMVQSNQGGWELIDTKYNVELASESYDLMNSLPSQDISLCVEDGVYLFNTYDNYNYTANDDGVNELEDSIMKITVNGRTLVEGSLLPEYQFFIIDGVAQECKCCSKPVLSPFNDITGEKYDDRVAKLLDEFYKLSSYDEIHNHETPQYKAACYILFDDTTKMTILDELMLERYVLYLFLSSTQYLSLGEALPADSCDIDGVACENGHLFKIMIGEYLLFKKIH